MSEKLAKLLDVKSIVTILLTLAFIYLAVTGTITGSEMLTIYATVIAFYFGVQSTKEKSK